MMVWRRRGGMKLRRELIPVCGFVTDDAGFVFETAVFVEVGSRSSFLLFLIKISCAHLDLDLDVKSFGRILEASIKTHHGLGSRPVVQAFWSRTSDAHAGASRHTLRNPAPNYFIQRTSSH